MKNKKVLSTSLSLGLSLALLIGNVSGNMNNVKAKEQGEKKQIYMIQASSEEKLDEVEHKYSIAETSAVENTDSVSTIYLTTQEAKELNEKEKNLVVEKDKVMHGFGKKTNFDLTDEQWNLKMIHANEETETVVKDKIKVAIIDSGIDYSDDIQVAERKNFVPDEDKVSVLYEDGSGHGTSVAGIIAAKDNQVGITGINDNVELYSAKVLDRNNQAPISRVIQAIDWAVEKQVNIINMSLGVSSYSSALHEAVKRAKQNGILIVTAAGNGGKIEYPAAFKETIAVGSIGPDGKVSEASSIGNMLDLVAPGEQILSTSAFEGVMASGGTSMAAPHVTGIASVLWQQDKNVSADFIKYLLCVTAKKLGDETKYGNGIVDLQYALSHYDELKKQYEELKKSQNVSDNLEIDSVNEHDLETFDDVDIVEGRWEGNTHLSFATKLTGDDLKVLKKGATLQDSASTGLKGKGAHPQFHGYHAHITTDKNVYVNYIACYVMLSKMAVVYATQKNYAEPAQGNWINSADYKALANAIGGGVGKLSWKQVLEKYTISQRNKALILYGMAIHTATDSFAHSAVFNNTRLTDKQGHVTSGDYAGSERLNAAKHVANKLIARIKKNSYDRGYVADFAVPSSIHKNKFKMASISSMANAVNSNTYQSNKAVFDALNIASFSYVK